MIAAKVQKGIFTWPGPLDLPHAFAYLPDLADAFVLLAGKADQLPPFSQFNFAGHTLTGAEFGKILETVTGTRLARKSVPWLLLRLLSTVNPMMREVVKMNYLWFTPHSLNGSKLQSLLGEVQNTSPEDAIRQSLIDQGFWQPTLAIGRAA
jgi:nucleoside-diphosphate-sugar epimerase